MVRLAAAGLCILVAGGCAADGSATTPTEPRVVRVVATNFGYEPSRIEVRPGELVRLVLENPTDLPHEAFIGSDREQAKHAALLAAPGADPADADVGDPSAVYVPPHGVAHLTYRFDDPAAVIIGCHLVGHWESGMRAEVVFAP